MNEAFLFESSYIATNLSDPMKKVLMSSAFAFLFVMVSGCGGSDEPSVVVGSADEAAKYETPVGAAEESAKEAAAAAAAAAKSGN